MAVFRFKPRVVVHPDRYGVVKTNPNRLLVVHTSEGGETPNAAENLCSFMGLPGDHIDETDGSRFGASYQYVTDTDEGAFPATPDNVVAYAAAGANHDGIHICIPGKAGQTRAQWLDVDSVAHINVLAWAMQRKAAQFNIPLVKLSVAQVRDGRTRGYCSHDDVSKAFGRSTHTDPGAAFPWDVLASLLVSDPPPDPPPTGGPIVADTLMLKDYRLYDSREHDGKLNGDRQLGVTDGEAAGAVAVLANITVVDAEAPTPQQFLAAWKGGMPWPGTSKMNWDLPGQTVANEITIPLSGFGQFMLRSSAPTNVIVDVVGYWMP